MADDIRFHGCQQATDWKDWISGESHLLIEPKIDGYRLSAVIDKSGHISFHSGRGESSRWTENLGHIADAIAELGLRNVMLDGKVMARTWSETRSLIRRKRSNMCAGFKERICNEVLFHTFDFIPLDLAREQRSLPKRRKLVEVVPMPLTERRGALVQTLYACPPEICLVPQFSVYSLQQLMNIYDELVDLDFEGAVAKVPGSPYAFARVDFWQKMKLMQTIEMTITGGHERGATKMLREFTCTLADGTAANCSAGFTDEMRERYWGNLPSLIGRSIEVKVRLATKSTAACAVFLRFHG